MLALTIFLSINIASAQSRLLPDDIALTPIENFDTTAHSRLNRFYEKLIAGDSVVRIAFMGDSFVEGDILTLDLRESLQTMYGGCGAGFAPMASPLTFFRPTIKTQSKGWTSYNVMQYRKTPSPYVDDFILSGWVCRPSSGASVEWKTATVRKHIDSCQTARILFLSRQPSRVEVTVNEKESQIYDFTGSEYLQHITVNNDAIHSVKMKLLSGEVGFVGYGAIFEGATKGRPSGVVVDNFSIRSNSGQAMFNTNADINSQIDKTIGGYDLVVLQYGLNIMQKGVTKYTAYSANVERMIDYVQSSSPNAAVLVMGVSDRSMKSGGRYTPMSEAPHLTNYQREAAENQGAAFWSTYDAMRAQGGMSNFVANKWAGGDHTHINFDGGRQVAYALTDAIVAGVEQRRSEMVKVVIYEPLIPESKHIEVVNSRILKIENYSPIKLPTQAPKRRKFKIILSELI